MVETAIICAPFAHLKICVSDDRVTGIEFLEKTCALNAPQPGSLAAEVKRQIDAYLDDPEVCFNLPCSAEGTAFQQRVWHLIRQIPCGQTRSYRDLAFELSTAARAIGGACGRNPLPLIVPCHRVVAMRGVGGFKQSSEKTLVDIKQWLLAHERRNDRPFSGSPVAE